MAFKKIKKRIKKVFLWLEKLAQQSDIIEYNEISFSVKKHAFWNTFDDEWELDTKRLYEQYATPDKKILDIGAWIGPTVLIGYANNAKHIYAIEADPRSAHILKVNCHTSLIDDRVTIINRCIYHTSYEIQMFGDNIVMVIHQQTLLGEDLKYFQPVSQILFPNTI